MQNIWLFQFEEGLDEQQSQLLADALRTKLADWKAHGTPVASKVVFRYGQFLFVEALNEVSGCGIDWLHQEMVALFQQLGIKLVDNSQIFYWYGDCIERIDFRELQDAIRSGKLTADTIVFDNHAIQQGEFERWEARLMDTWMHRYLTMAAH